MTFSERDNRTVWKKHQFAHTGGLALEKAGDLSQDGLSS